MSKLRGADLRDFRIVFDKVQISRAAFEKCHKVLLDIYKRSNFDDFFEDFSMLLLNLFITDIKIKNEYVQRAMEFMAKFAGSLCENDESDVLFSTLIKDILQFHNAQKTEVRYHICEFIKMLLNEAGDTSLEDELLDEISSALQVRINDIKQNVRFQAVLASHRLQDPYNKEDPILNSYFKALATESSPVIRKAIVETMAINAKTLSVIVQRCLDSNDTVRLAAYLKLSKIPVKSLRLEQRQFVLRNGLGTDHKITTLVTKTLLPKWLSKYDKNYLEFCKALKLDATEEEFKQTTELLEEILPHIFQLSPANELKDILNFDEKKLPSELTFESSLYWRCLISFFMKNFGDEPVAEEILPDLMQLLEYIQKFYKKMKTSNNEWEILKESQILNQLLQIVLNYEILDTHQRARTNDFIHDLLSDAFLNYENVLVLCKIFEKIDPDLDSRSEKICTIVSNIKDPLIEIPPQAVVGESVTIAPSAGDLQKRDLRLAPLRVKLNELRDDMDQAIIRQDFQQAEKMKNEISSTEKQIDDIRKEFEEVQVTLATQYQPTSSNAQTTNDPHRITKCMELLIAFLRCSTITTLTTSLKMCMENFVKENLLSIYEFNSDCKALHCYGLMCIFDKKEAFESIQIFCQQLILYHYHIAYNSNGLLYSSKVVTDLLLLHGPRILGEEGYEDVGTTRKSKKSLYDKTDVEESMKHVTKANLQLVVEIYSDMLDDPIPELREMGGTCLVKLLYHNVIKAPGILSKLIIKWFNPVTEKDNKLRQILGLFFSMYACNVAGSLSMFEKAFIPTLNIVVNAPKNSPLVDIDLDSVIKFMVDICRTNETNLEKVDVHKNLAVKLLSEISTRPHDNTTWLFIKTLLLLDLPHNDLLVIEELKSEANKILSQFDDKSQRPMKKNIEKFLSNLDSINFDPMNNNEEEELSGGISSIQLGKRKRDPSHESKNSLTNVNEENQDPSSEEILIENVNSDEKVAPIEKETEPEIVLPPPRKTLRKSARRLRT